MALRVSAQVIRSDIFDTPFIDVAGGNVAGDDQVAKPLRRIRVDLVVIDAAHSSSSCSNGMPGHVCQPFWAFSRQWTTRRFQGTCSPHTSLPSSGTM